MENKIKIRSSKDLNYRKKGFLEICNILEDNKIQYFIWEPFLVLKGIKFYQMGLGC